MMDAADAIRAEANIEDGWPYPDDNSDMTTHLVNPGEDEYGWTEEDYFDLDFREDLYGG